MCLLILSVFFDRAFRQANPAIIKQSTKRPAYTCKNLQIVQVNAINPFPVHRYTMLYCWASIVACNARHLSSFAWWTQDASFVLLQARYYKHYPVVWAFGTAIDLEWHQIPFVYSDLSNVIVILFDPWHMSNHVWSKSATWQRPPTRGTFLDHIWLKSTAWQSPLTRGTFWTTFGQNLQHDKVLRWGTHFGPHLVVLTAGPFLA